MTFQDIFQSSFLESVREFSLLDTLLALVFSFIIGLFIFLIYKRTFSGVLYSSGFAVTLVGLAMVTTLVILAVTSNVVLSLGMVGALSIVRFRAAIKEPMEIVFLFWSLAVGIVVGAGFIPLAVIGSVIIGLILLLFANRKTLDQLYVLVIHCDDEEAEAKASEQVRMHARRCAVKSKSVGPGGIELTTEVRLRDAGTAFVNSLCAIEGVSDAVLVSYNGEYMS